MKIDSDSEKQTVNQHLSSPSSRLSLTPSLQTLPPSSAARDGGVQSVHNRSSPPLLPSDTFPLLQVGPSMSCSTAGKILLWPEVSPGHRSGLCSGVGSPRGCRAPSAPAPGVPPTLLLLSPRCSHYCFSLSLFPSSPAPLPFLKYVIMDVPHVADGLSCVLWWVCWSKLESACPAWGSLSLLPLLPVSPPLSKPWHLHPMYELVCLPPRQQCF